MNWLAVAGFSVVLIVALLVARGMYVIGSGSEAELEARKRMRSDTAQIGRTLLWRLRTGRVPIVSAIEAKLGWDRDEEVDDDAE